MEFLMTLTPDLENQIISELLVAFPDQTELFSSSPLILNLRLAMAAFVKTKFQVQRLKVFADRYYAKGLFVSKTKKAELELIRLIFATCCVLLLSKNDSVRRKFKHESEAHEMLELYVAADRALFSTIMEAEISRLVRFRNILKTALLIIPTRLNKQLIVNIACRLQTPKPCIYTWGVSMSAELKRLVAIYHLETGVPVEKREPRPRVSARSNALSISSHNGVASKIVSDSDSETASPASKKMRPDLTVSHSVDPTACFLMHNYQRVPVERVPQTSELSELMQNYVVEGEDDFSYDFPLPHCDKHASLSDMLNFSHE